MPPAHEQAAQAPARAQADTDGAGAEDAPQHDRARRRPPRAAAVVLVVGLAITAGLALSTLAIYNSNENRLLHLRLRELNLVLAASAPTAQTPLATATALASATGGDSRRLRQFISPSVGPGRQFGSVSLWPLVSGRLAPTVVVGPRPRVLSMPQAAVRRLLLGAKPGQLNLSGDLQSPHPSVTDVFREASGNPPYAVLAESPLPPSRRSRLQSNSAFSDLDYALFLGRTHSPTRLLVTSVTKLPMTGRTATESVTFGASALTLTVRPRVSLGGAFFHDLPWFIAGLGVLITLAAAALTERLVRRRQDAEQLAGRLDRLAAENQRMYAEQRTISQTLQHALLPESLPQPPGTEVGARYVPAAAGADVGGDWYDVVVVGEERLLVIIGDVSGHGVRAATNMALVRHAALAYLAVDDRPAHVLARLSAFVNAREHDYFATVLCAALDREQGTLTVASAGHLAPLLVEPEEARFVDVQPQAPIGVPWSGEYTETELPVPSSATLIAYTDGLVERRGEMLDMGLERLRQAAAREPLPLEQLLERLVQDLTGGGLHDDTAIVGVTWRM